MAIRIDRIKVNRGGPLRSDVEFKAGDLNLIYGQNETGKTYIVETMINFLFRTGSKSPAKWELRDWDANGRIIVTGLEDKPLSFTKTGKKLEHFWEEDSGLPSDLSRLLVVKAGDTLLIEDEIDGVGRRILKDCLSGKGFLDSMSKRIPVTLQKTTILNRQIVGEQRGEIINRVDCAARLQKLNTLRTDFEDGYATGEVYSLRLKKEMTVAELNNLEKAKRYFAGQLHEQIQTLLKTKNELPAEEGLTKLEKDIGIYDMKQAEAKTKLDKLSELEGSSDNYRWVKAAREDYSEIVSKQSSSGPKPILIILAFLFFLVAVITGLFGLNVPLIACSIAAIVFFFLYYMKTKNALAIQGKSEELDKLKLDYSKRFGSQLTNKAALDAQLEKLNENYIRANTLREASSELTLEVNTYKIRITKTLNDFTGAEKQPQQWEESVRVLKSERKELEEEILSRDRKLASLGLKEGEFLDKHPGVKWDANRYDIISEELSDIDENLNEKLTKLDELKVRINQETGSKSSEREILFTELSNLCSQVAEEYKNITSGILAKVMVNSVIEEFRKKEDARIEDGLNRDEVLKPLQALTVGRYNKITLDEEKGLILATVEDEEFPLVDISTGAREQILIALRIGFASIVMEGQAAFLILDDAFQHSDWDRRKIMVDYTINLVKNGWQIFYFAMDDHIRDLFLNNGKKLGVKFQSLELH